MNVKDFRKEISLRFKKVREVLNCSQEKMAARLEVERVSYTKYESGKALPGHYRLNILARHFDVSLDWLIADKGPMFYKGKVNAVEDTEEFTAEMKELFDHMSRIPLLRHEVLSCFHKFKLDYKDLVESSPPRGPSTPIGEI
ncbi:MAG: helix-turn-helix transcriptional regulator [bacterium]|nr:helix-turn-helix transcriptional regulator [bacterium]